MLSAMKKNGASTGHRESERGLHTYIVSLGKALQRRLCWNRTLQEAGNEVCRYLREACSGTDEHVVWRLLRRSMLAVFSDNQEPKLPSKSERSAAWQEVGHLLGASIIT